MKARFISIPFKIEAPHGLSMVDGIAKVSTAGIILEFEVKLLWLMGQGVKEVKIRPAEIEEIKLKKKFYGTKIEIRLNNFKTLSELPNKDGRLTLKINKADRERAEQAVELLEKQMSESELLLESSTTARSLFDNSEADTQKFETDK